MKNKEEQFYIYARWGNGEETYADTCSFVIDQYALGNPDSFYMMSQLVADKYINKFWVAEVWTQEMKGEKLQ